jgi:hypothetical protein
VSRSALQAHAVAPPADQADLQTLVGCGRALINERIAIVEPDGCRRLPADEVGEIWVNGPNVAGVYWRNPEATKTGLNARIAGEDDGANWLRTGDLGFFDANGELFITGRIKDLIIIRGINHYPQDIEHTVQSLHPALRQNCGAAFSIGDERGEETLVIVQEVERTERNRIDAAEIKGLIREGVTDQHELFARHIVLIRPGTLPKTTSGKIQRNLTRKLWLERHFEDLAAGADCSEVDPGGVAELNARSYSLRYPGCQVRAIMNEVHKVRAVTCHGIVNAIVDKIAMGAAGHDSPQGCIARLPIRRRASAGLRDGRVIGRGHGQNDGNIDRKLLDHVVEPRHFGKDIAAGKRDRRGWIFGPVDLPEQPCRPNVLGSEGARRIHTLAQAEAD